MEWLSQLARRALDAWHQRAIALKALSFAVVGVVNSAVDFGVFSFATTISPCRSSPPTCSPGSSR
jgi:hypothetical protein